MRWCALKTRTDQTSELRKPLDKAVQIAAGCLAAGDSRNMVRPFESPAGVKMQSQMTKSQLIEKIAQLRELAKKDVKGMMEALAEVGYKELKKNGVFVVPGFAKFVVIKKAATKARKGINPFNGQEMTFKAKPARKIVRARPVKAAKMAV
jgi:nucleoid DNA-binding protein